MKKQPLRVAFVGGNTPSFLRVLANLSPAIDPLVFPDWSHWTRSPTGSIELAVVLPGMSDRPPFSVGVQLLSLNDEHLRKGASWLEQRILGEPIVPSHPDPLDRILGISLAMDRMRGQLVTTAKTSLPLLLTGENGTGKDLAATVAHQLSPRAEQPFIAVNCSAIPVGLAETEFFGCVRGAFTGAENRTGFCQQALGGTLFLDEIGELPLEIQSKLLRTLENKEVRRVGSIRTEETDFRLICATNRDLKSEVQLGRFREDLYYRINVLPIKMPSLRERKEDIPLLATHFLTTEGLGRETPVRLGTRAAVRLTEYDWPGNLRQLRNVVLRAAVLYGESELSPHHLDWEC